MRAVTASTIGLTRRCGLPCFSARYTDDGGAVLGRGLAEVATSLAGVTGHLSATPTP
jgi:hypothetical protein